MANIKQMIREPKSLMKLGLVGRPLKRKQPSQKGEKLWERKTKQNRQKNNTTDIVMGIG